MLLRLGLGYGNQNESLEKFDAFAKVCCRGVSHAHDQGQVGVQGLRHAFQEGKANRTDCCLTNYEGRASAPYSQQLHLRSGADGSDYPVGALHGDSCSHFDSLCRESGYMRCATVRTGLVSEDSTPGEGTYSEMRWGLTCANVLIAQFWVRIGQEKLSRTDGAN